MKWVFGTLVLLVTGILFQLGLLVYAMYVLLGMLVVSRFLARRWIERVRVLREDVPERLDIGQSLAIRLELENQSRIPVPWLLLEDSLPIEALTRTPPGIRVEGSVVNLMQLGSRGREEIAYTVQFLSRGYYQIGPLLMETGDLFGLQRRFRIATRPNFVLVLPKVVPLENYDLVSRRPVGELRLSYRLFEDPTRICGVRQYEMGDPLNRVHWRATARTGVLHSKLYEPSCIVGATLLLDFHTDSFRGPGAAYCRELAITTAATLASAIHQMEQPAGLITNGRDAADRIREEGWKEEFRTRRAAQRKLNLRAANDRLRPVMVPGRRGEGQLMALLETLARLECTDGLAFPALVGETTGRLPRNTTVIAILSTVSPETALALGNLRRNGYAVTAVLVVFDDPATPNWAKLPDWAAWLLREGVEVRRVENEEALAWLCSEKQVKGLVG